MAKPRVKLELDEGAGNRWSLRSLPTQGILWFYKRKLWKKSSRTPWVLTTCLLLWATLHVTTQTWGICLWGTFLPLLITRGRKWALWGVTGLILEVRLDVGWLSGNIYFFLPRVMTLGWVAGSLNVADLPSLIEPFHRMRIIEPWNCLSWKGPLKAI